MVISDTQITTTVPNGAPTGSITVINTNGDEAISNSDFAVTAAMTPAPPAPITTAATVPATTATTTTPTPAFTPGSACSSSTCAAGIYDVNGNCVCTTPSAIPAAITTPAIITPPAFTPGGTCSTSNCTAGVYDINGNCICSTSPSGQAGRWTIMTPLGPMRQQTAMMGGLGLIIILLLLFR